MAEIEKRAKVKATELITFFRRSIRRITIEECKLCAKRVTKECISVVEDESFYEEVNREIDKFDLRIGL